MVTASGSALAAPASFHLLPRVDASSTSVRLLQTDEADPLAGVQVDPHARRLVGKEVLIGAAMVMGADFVTALFGGLVGGVVWLASQDPLPSIVAGYLTFLASNFFLAPVAAALGAYGVAPSGGNNGLLGALLGAGVGQLLSTALFVGTGIGFGVLWGVLRPESLAAQGAALGVSLLIFALHWAIIPAAASLGIHWTAPPRDPKPELTPRPARAARPARPPTTPHEVYVQALVTPPAALTLRF